MRHIVIMKYFCAVIVLACLVDSSSSTTQSGNVTFPEGSEQLKIVNKTNETNDSSTTSYSHRDVNDTENSSHSENITEVYATDCRRDILSGPGGEQGNNKTSEEKSAIDAPYVGFGLTELAGIATLCFLVFSVFGYIGFVLLRKYLLNKYGNSQNLITEEEYDTSDLRNFEI